MAGLWVLAAAAGAFPALKSWTSRGPDRPPILYVTGRSASGEATLAWSPGNLNSPNQAETPAVGGWAGLLLGNPLDVNRAGITDFEALPGIGPVTAQAIVDLRTERTRFESLEDLLEVSGIGPKTLERLRPWLCVDESAPPTSRR